MEKERQIEGRNFSRVERGLIFVIAIVALLMAFLVWSQPRKVVEMAGDGSVLKKNYLLR